VNEKGADGDIGKRSDLQRGADKTSEEADKTPEEAVAGRGGEKERGK
jgi:hypothetical protein